MIDRNKILFWYLQPLSAERDDIYFFCILWYQHGEGEIPSHNAFVQSDDIYIIMIIIMYDHNLFHPANQELIERDFSLIVNILRHL